MALKTTLALIGISFVPEMVRFLTLPTPAAIQVSRLSFFVPFAPFRG